MVIELCCYNSRRKMLVGLVGPVAAKESSFAGRNRLRAQGVASHLAQPFSPIPITKGTNVVNNCGAELHRG